MSVFVKKYFSFAFAFSLVFLRVQADLVMQAVQVLLEDHHSTISNQLSVVYAFTARSEVIENSIDNFVKIRNELFSGRVINLRESQNVTLKVPALVIFDSFESIYPFMEQLQGHPSKRLQHVFYSPGLTFEELQKSVQRIHPFDLYSVAFLVEDENAVSLISSFIFLPDACRQNTLRVINTFQRATLSW